MTNIAPINARLILEIVVSKIALKLMMENPFKTKLIKTEIGIIKPKIMGIKHIKIQ